MFLAVRRGQRSDHRERSRDRGDAQSPRQAVPQRIDLFAHRAAVADDAARPFQDALPLRGEALKARTTADQQHTHLIFELLYPRRERRLRYPAGLGSVAKMPFPRQCENEF